MAKVYLTFQAQSDLKKISKSDRLRIMKKLYLLEKDCYIGKKLTGKLAKFFSLKTWPYRIIYLINSKRGVWIVHIMHRKDVYRQLK